MLTAKNFIPTGPVHTVQSFAKTEPAFPEGSTRWIIFQYKEKLIEAGAIFYNGRKLLIDRERFINCIKKGL